MVPADMYAIMTSNDDADHHDNSLKTARFQKLFKTRADCKKLAQDKKFWIAKLKADYDIDFKKLESQDPFGEYVNFTRIVDSDFAWYFMFEANFKPNSTVQLRRASVLLYLTGIYIKLKADGVALLPIHHSKIEMTSDTFMIQIHPQPRQTIPCGKIIKSLNSLKMGAWWMPMATTSLKSLYDQVFTADVTEVETGTEHKQIIVFQCGTYYVCVTPAGVALNQSDFINIANIKVMSDAKINM